MHKKLLFIETIDDFQATNIIKYTPIGIYEALDERNFKVLSKDRKQHCVLSYDHSFGIHGFFYFCDEDRVQ
jgi:hypothetical protein